MSRRSSKSPFWNGLLLACLTSISFSSQAKSQRLQTTCLRENQISLGVLACVACGLERFAEIDVHELGQGADHWIALVGIMAQRIYGPFNLRDENQKKKFQERVIEMVSAYGYCTNREFPTETLSSYPNASRDWIENKMSIEVGEEASSKASPFARVFGFGCSNASQCVEKIFAETGSQFEAAHVQERQWRFRSRLEAFLKNQPTGVFKSCGQSLKSRQRHLKALSFCPIQLKRQIRRADQVIYPERLTPEELAAHQQLQQSLTESCGLDKYQITSPALCYFGCVPGAELENCKQEILGKTPARTTPVQPNTETKR